MADSKRSLLDWAKKIVGPVFGLILFSIAARFLYQKMHEITWQEFTAGVASIPVGYHVLAMLLVAVNYLVLTGNDLLAVQFAGAGGVKQRDDQSPITYPKIALASFLGYALGNNIGAVAAGIPIRVRFYGGWGMKATQIVAVIAFTSLSFWVGFCMVGGTMLSLVEVPIPKQISLPVTSRLLGFILLAVIGSYAATCTWWRRPIGFGSFQLQPPGPRLMVHQIAVASLDLMLAATALYVLLPAGIDANYQQVVAVYLLALAATMITQVPGGLGVLEAILLSLLTGSEESVVLGALLIFRIYYYVIPLLVAVLTLVVVEASSMRKRKL